MWSALSTGWPTWPPAASGTNAARSLATAAWSALVSAPRPVRAYATTATSWAEPGNSRCARFSSQVASALCGSHALALLFSAR